MARTTPRLRREPGASSGSRTWLTAAQVLWLSSAAFQDRRWKAGLEVEHHRTETRAQMEFIQLPTN